jgi:hypothetical protein
MTQNKNLKDSQRTNWLNTLLLSGTDNLNIFTLTSKGDEEKKSYQIMLVMRIFHLICISTIFISILLLTVILPWVGFHPYHTDINGVIAFVIVFYPISTLFGILGFNWGRIFKGYHNNNTLLEDYRSHVFRISICFETSIGFAFIMGIGGISWFLISPLLIFGGISLILTYPTNKKMAMLLKENS